MNTKQWLKIGMLALLIGAWNLPSPTTADVIKQENLAETCSGGCVDTWQVNCKDSKTHALGARISINGAADMFAVSAVGYKGLDALIGQADQERTNPDIGLPYPFTNYSSNAATLLRPGTSKGATSALVLVEVLYISPGIPHNYTLEFSCHDVNGTALKDPVVTLLQDK